MRIVEIDWGTPDGTKTASGSWLYEVMSSQGFPFQGPGCWGTAIFSERKKGVGLGWALGEDGLLRLLASGKGLTHRLPPCSLHSKEEYRQGLGTERIYLIRKAVLTEF